MRFLSLAALAALLMGGVSGTAYAQNGRIRGFVRDAHNSPLAGAVVRAIGPGPAHRAAPLDAGAPVRGGATLDVHAHAGTPALRPKATIHAGPAIVEHTAVGAGAAVGEWFVAHGVASRVEIRANVPVSGRVG